MSVAKERGAPAAVAARRIARPQPLRFDAVLTVDMLLMVDCESDSSSASGRFHVTRWMCAASSVAKCICIATVLFSILLRTDECATPRREATYQTP